MMYDAVLPYLRCPVCAQPLERAQRAVRCPRGHSFDLARQGYANLTTGRMPHDGDTADMVAARADFLAAGHYDDISAALARAATSASAGGLVLDAGTGTGRHLAAVLDALPQAVGLGLDVSKPALRRAARCHRRAAAALADVWRPLPVADGSVAALLNVFAPRNGAEYHRVLRPDGALLVVTPAADHLTELVSRLDLLRVDPDKRRRLVAGLGGLFTVTADSTYRWRMTLGHEEVSTLVGMGPSAWHTGPAALAARIAGLPSPLTVTAAVQLQVLRPR